MTVSVIQKGRTDKWGRTPLQLRISENGKRRFIPLHIKVTAAEWDSDNMLVKTSCPFHKEHNRKIRLRVAQVENGMEDREEKKAETVFQTYAMHCFAIWEKELAWNTIRGYYSDRNNLKAYNPALMLHEITPSWWDKYKAWLYGKGLGSNSVADAWKYMRKVLLQAQKDKLIGEIALADFDVPKYRDPKRIHLSLEQVQSIINVSRDTGYNKEVRTTAAWFAIGCFTGLSYVDMTAFNKELWLKDGVLYFAREKTNTPVSLPLMDEVRKLLEQVRFEPLKITNQNFNRMLKQVAAFAGIRETLTAHCARHTFGTLMLAAGADLYHVSKMLGHTQIKTTQIYAQIVSPKLHEEYKKLFNRK